MKHYFTDNQIQIKNRKEISFRFLDFNIKLHTADNMFSKDHVDQGSEILLNTIYGEEFGECVLDYGCGYGVIGIALSKMGLNVEAVDIVDRAIELTTENAAMNNVKINAFNITEKSLEENRYSDIVLNPPIRTGKQNIFSMYQIAYDALNKDGTFYIVIRKQHGAKSSIKELEDIFREVTVINKEKGYWVIKCIK